MRPGAAAFLSLLFASLLAGAGAAFAAPASGPVIHEIEVEGVTALSEEDVTGLIEVAVGERLEKDRAVRTATSLRNLYLQNGYRDAKISVRILKQTGADGREQNVLSYKVEEGLPTRLEKVELVIREGGKGSEDPGARRAVSRLQEDLSGRGGEVLTQDKLNELIQSVEEGLADRGFLGGTVDRPETLPGTAPPGRPAAEKAAWARVRFELDPGDRVSFGFRGNERLTTPQLLDLVSSLREIGLGRDYLEVIRNRVLQEYHAMGYAEVKVTALTYAGEAPEGRCAAWVPEGGGLTQESGGLQSLVRRRSCATAMERDRRVTFIIDEGQRYSIDSLEFDGNSAFAAEDLQDQFQSFATARVGRRIYVEDEVEKTSELVVEWIKSKGYLSAKLVTINRQRSPRGRGYRLTVYLYEGEQTLVHAMSYSGATVFTEAEINGMLGLEPRQPLNLFAFSEGLEILKSAYRRKGYLDAAILNEGTDSVIRYLEKNRFADITLKLREGPQFKVSSIEIEGIKQTRREVVTRELTFAEGGILDEDKLVSSEGRLRRLGIFTNVQIQHRTDPARADSKQVRVQVAETTPGVYGAGVGYRNDLGGRVFGEVGYTNLHGRNHSVTLGGNANRRFTDYRYVEYQVQLGYTWPWFLVPELTFRPQLTRESRQFINFDAESSLFTATFERSLFDRWGLVGGLTYSLERTRQYNVRNLIDDVTLTIGSIIPSLTVDLRDNPLAPEKGFYASASYEIASTAFGSQAEPFPVGYTRFQFRSDYTFPFGQGVSWYVSFRTGFGRNTVSPENSDGSIDKRVGIPLIKLFTLGGVRSLRGYKLQELNLEKFAVRGTMAYVNYRTQLDIPLAGSLKMGPFLDAANLLVDSYSLGNLRAGAGFGLHYMTPVGPVNFDLGFKLDRQPGEDPKEFHFSVGIL